MESMHHRVAIEPGLVRAKAYEIWESLGCPEGAAERTWFEAEQELKSRLAETSPASGRVVISEPPQAPAVATQPKKSSASPRRTTRR